LATFREAVAQLRRGLGGRVGDDAALLAMARAVLGGPNDGGRSSYQISLSVCPGCGRGAQRAAGERVEVSPEAVGMAQCDAQHVALIGNDISRVDDMSEAGAVSEADAVSQAGGASRVDDNLRASGVHGADTDRLASPARPARDAAPTVLSLQRQAPANDGPTAPAAVRDNFAAPPAVGQTIAAHVGMIAPQRHRAHHRTTQSVPPAVRRRVLLRDEHVCRVPGCRNALYLDLHHVTPRVEGGPNVEENLVCLCGVHHRATHAGELLIEGQSARSLRFLHADGTPFGGSLDPHALDANTKVFSALRNLGFREAEARRVLNELRRHPDTRCLATAALLRAALERIGPRGA
jgi:hypothetical protein